MIRSNFISLETALRNESFPLNVDKNDEVFIETMK
jgi:hypothetical protein